MKKTIARNFRYVNIFVLLALVSGCHSNSQKPETPPQASHLRTISINPNVKLTTKPIYRSASGTTAAILAGPLVGLAVKAATSNDAELKTLAESKDVDLRNLVISNFREQLTKAGSPITLAEKDAEAELQIEIDEYGLTARVSAMQPIISVAAKLVKLNGKEIWSDSESYSRPDVSGVSAQTWQNYVATPSLLKNSFNEIAKIATTEIVDNLFESHKNGEIEE